MAIALADVDRVPSSFRYGPGIIVVTAKEYVAISIDAANHKLHPLVQQALRREAR